MRGNGNYQAEQLEKGLVRLHKVTGRKPAVGNFLVMRHSSRDHAGIFLLHCHNLEHEDAGMMSNFEVVG